MLSEQADDKDLITDSNFFVFDKLFR